MVPTISLGIFTGILLSNTGMDYLAGNATKYVSRWRKKDGIKDLEKALHYVDKLIENAPLCARNQRRPSQAWLMVEASDFCCANSLTEFERWFVIELTSWQMPSDLRRIQKALSEFIRDEFRLSGYRAAEKLPGNAVSAGQEEVF